MRLILHRSVSKLNRTKKKNATSGKAKVSWAYSDDKKHLQHVIPAAYAVSYRAKPDKAGGWGCNPHTEDARRILFYIGLSPNQTERNQTK